MNKLVTELHLIGNDNNIFDTDIEYIIPLYQRAYAWEDKQLIQLIEDIQNVVEETNYYIGSLIVSKQAGKYEVVDGQQRLTSLFLLLNCLGEKVNPTLTFSCREKSNYTLKNIKELLQEDYSKLDMDKIESSIQRGVKILSYELNKKNFCKESFMKKLAKVIVYRIELPENTDLNRYFEIMNTRGEQLEQHDILKATLMSYLNNQHDKDLFAKIWDACSDMTGYVQMHFVSEVREVIFGNEWNSMPPNSWSEYKRNMKNDESETSGFNINDIINKNCKTEDDKGYVDDDIRVQFKSIIEFSYFLLHSLKVFVELYKIKHEKEDKKITDELLDDKKLIDAFNKVFSHGVVEGRKITDNKEEFSRKFIICLLRTRYLFDKYIIKRQYTTDNTDGIWSLKSVHVSGQKSYHYGNTRFTETNEADSNKTNIMIQSALRVSYISPKVMHWITKLLIWLSEDEYEHINNNDVAKFYEIAEQFAIKAVNDNFFNVCKDGIFAMGTNTPHIVFNYLDYLLWDNNRKKYNDFVFEFRNSVEHWYPQNPSEGTFEQWKDNVNRFGNLCIIQRNINSKFSNMSPEAKKSTFSGMISKGSIKLRIMSEVTEKNDNKTASLYWKETMYEKHEKEMLKYLRDRCGAN